MSVKWFSKLVFAAPWAVSLALHAAVILPLVFVVMISGSKPAADVLYPEAGFSETLAGQFDGSGAGTDSQAPLNADAPPVQEHRAEAAMPLVGPAGGAVASPIELIGIGGGGQAGGTPGTLGLAAAGGAPRGSFFGIKTGGNVHHIVFVVDRSGSMITGGAFELAQDRLLRFIGGLSERQDFHIIYFADVRTVENPPGKLVSASLANKRQAGGFIHKVWMAGNASDKKRPTNPVPALRRAFEVLREADPAKPGWVIYFLTDGDPNDSATADAYKVISELNQDKKVIVNTVLVYPEGNDGIIKRIADENGGSFKVVSLDE